MSLRREGGLALSEGPRGSSAPSPRSGARFKSTFWPQCWALVGRGMGTLCARGWRCGCSESVGAGGWGAGVMGRVLAMRTQLQTANRGSWVPVM